MFQKILGELFKIKSSNRQVLQLLQRLGLSLVSKALWSDMNVISTHFMKDVQERKLEIEQWAKEREIYEKEVKSELILSAQCYNSLNLEGQVIVRFTSGELIPEIVDLSEIEVIDPKADLALDKNVLEMILQRGSAKAALENHLDNCPTAFTVTYDNIDIGSIPNEYISDVTKDQSLHWCSTIVFEDVVTGNELIDHHAERPNNADFSELVKISKDERNHLLENYTKLVIAKNWPTCFPDMQSKQITHQYTRKFEAGVTSFTGPLVCETESTLEGISVVLKTLVDVVCPAKVDKNGSKSPIHLTTFR